MNMNVNMVSKVARIAKRIVANDGWDMNEIRFCRDQFEKDLQDASNPENRRGKARGEFPLDDETMKKCLDTFDELFEEVVKYASPGTQYPENLCDKYMEKFKDAPKQCRGLLSSLFYDESKQLGLKG